MTERMPATEHANIGRYLDLTLLGQGGMGAVYRGRDPELDRAVAIKVMLDASPEFVARFRREAQSIARLTHPNIVQVYDFGVDDGKSPYFVMELIEGTALDRIVRDRGRLLPVEAIRLARQAAAGLVAAHRAGIVHRDIKPSNLILDASGVLKLVDFGIARVQDPGAQALTGAASLMGTPGYMAPEQAAGKIVDHRADIYALGLTLFELLSGQPPYTAADAISLVVKNLQDPLPDLRVRGFGIPDELVTLVEMMGAKDPDDRIQSCVAVIAALDEIVQQMKTGRIDAPLANDEIPPTHVRGRRGGAALASGEIPPTNVHGRRPVAAAVARALGVGLALAGAGATTYVLSPSRPQGPPRMVGSVDVDPPPPGPSGARVVSNARPASTEGEPPSGQGLREGPLRVAVLKFRNVSGDHALGTLEQGIGEAAVTAMAGASKAVTLIERNDIDSDIGEIDRAGDYHFDRLTVAKAGQLKGIEVAVQGGLQKAGNKLRITARFVRVETGEVLDTVTVTTSARKVFDAQDEVAAKLKAQVVALAHEEGAR